MTALHPGTLRWVADEILCKGRLPAVADPAVFLHGLADAIDRTHITDGRPCWCGPHVEVQPDGSEIIIHNELAGLP